MLSRKPSGRPEWAGFLPIWSCSVWGLPCPPHYCGGGALLPHLFTLTPPILARTREQLRSLPEWAGRYVFCGTFRRTSLNSSSRMLSGTPLCGVRTFLPAHSRDPADSHMRDSATRIALEITRMGGATVRSSCLLSNYMRQASDGMSEFDISSSTFHVSSGCLSQTIRYLPLSKNSFPRAGRNLIS